MLYLYINIILDTKILIENVTFFCRKDASFHNNNYLCILHSISQNY